MNRESLAFSDGSVNLEMPPPLLVVEVVSPDKSARDYIYKRSEYAIRGISDYWIVDAIQNKVTVLNLVEECYTETVFAGEEPLFSPTFPSLV
ncbi:MAG: Uma2 family endonuclease [Microcystis panniformis]